MSTYAVISTGGKQYRVAADQTIKVEKLEAEIGADINLQEVRLLSQEGEITTDQAALAKAHVIAEVVAQKRHKKIRILKFKRRKHHMKQMGHRQYFTLLKIKSINAA
jgi:large subunit ribosomal protein L21